MNPPSTSSSSSSKSSTSSAPSVSKPLEESDNEEEFTSQQVEISAQAERIASLELLVRELLASQAQQSNRTNSSSNVTGASNRITHGDVNGSIEPRSVPKKNYLVTAPSVSKQLLANRIHADTKDSFMKINMIRGSLTTAGLKYLLDGHRKKPIPTEFNRFGYTERCIQTVETIDDTTGLTVTQDIMIDEDDCFCYDYDCGRLYSAIIEIFGDTLYYLVTKEIDTGDGKEIYRKIMLHLNGQRAKDADGAREIYNNYKMNENITFKMEHAKFDQVFTNLEYAQKRELTSAEKLQFLAPKIIHDRRIGLREVMLQSSIHDWHYEKTVTTLIKVNSGLPENDQTVTMAAVSYHRNNNSNNTSQYKSTSTSAPTIKSPKYCFLRSEERRVGKECSS